ncbi:thermonuclease family protein [Patescibacteria group bacterium]|nr:thermonuclease family protein [Patescibacteria group bacterium]
MKSYKKWDDMTIKEKIVGVIGLVVVISIFISILSPSKNKTDLNNQQNGKIAGDTSETQKTVNPATPTGKSSDTQVQTETFKVTKIIDGDTIEIEGGQKIRYIGIDTPELNQDECYASEATSINAKLVFGKEIRTEKDISETDKYGRLLRYIWVDDIFVNDYLVRSGYARSISYPPDIKYQEQFKEAQQEAISSNSGLWNDCKSVSSSTPQPTTQVEQSGNCKYSCDGSDRDCDDFSTHAEAQTFFNCCGFTATYDPMKLDGIKIDDGFACESLP